MEIETDTFVTTLSHPSADPFRLLVEAVKDYGIFMLDPAGNVSSWNPGAEKSEGYTSDEIIGRHFSCFYTPEDVAADKPARGLLIALEKGRFEEEGLRLRKGGEPFWATVTITCIYDVLGQHLGFANVTHDVTERRRLESQRDALLSRLQLHIQSLPFAYILFDVDSRITDWNPSAERIFGYTRTEMLGEGLPYEQLVPDLCFQHGKECRRGLKPGDMGIYSKNENLTKDGRTITCKWFNTPLVDKNGEFIGFLCLAQDVTEEISVEAQLIEAQKMEVIGHLAGGVAHDFNNILAIIMGYSDLITSELVPDGKLLKYVDQIHLAADRAAGLTRQLLVFSRKEKVQPVVLDLNDIVKDLREILRRLVDENIKMTVVCGEQLRNINADSGYVGQVLMNLVVNARDAMPNGGELTIETSEVALDQASARAHPGVAPGAYVRLAVADTGVGMTDEVKQRLFQAFFTTKAPGKGTGLGLSTCQTIVQQSGGYISVHSELGKGTTFEVFFPCVERPLAIAAKPSEGTPALGGTETLLVVEDDQFVRNLARNVLEAQGYKVLAASNGKEGLRIAHEHKGPPIRLVISDVVMPLMDGKVMGEWLQTTYPELKMLFTSGYTDDVIAHHGILEAGIEFLPKPYVPAALVRRVRTLLDT